MKRLFLILALLLVTGYQSASAQQTVQDSTLLTLDRIYSREFQGEFLQPMKWLQNEDAYAILKPSPEGGVEIVKVDVSTGKETILVSRNDLIPENDSIPLYPADYTWSKNKKYLLIFTNTRRVWRRNTRGDYYVLDMKNKKLVKLGDKFPESSLMFAKISPDESKAAYVVKDDYDIYVEDLQTHQITPVTTDGNKDIINGTSDWVYEEEFSLRDGFYWSPDSKKILFYRFDTRGVPVFHMINNTDSLYPKIISFQYPKAGTRNSMVTLGVYDFTKNTVTYLNIPGDPGNNYIPRAAWAKNSREIILQRMNRLQNENQIALVDVEKNRYRVLFTDRDSAWVDYSQKFYFIKKGKYLLYLSDRDGWRHVYRIDRKGRIKNLTPGTYDVISIAHIDEKKGWLYFIASPENAAQRYLYKIKLNGKGSLKRVTPRKFTGTNSYNISPGGKFAVHTFTTFETPYQFSLISLPKHKKIRDLVTNEKLKKKIQTLKKTPVEFFKIQIEDGVTLDGWMMKPYNFNPSKKYPVFFYVYGEPAGQTVLDAFRYSQYLWHLYLTQQGYIVISVDNRGTPAPRGRAWRKIGYKKLGCLTTADQAKAASIIRTWSFVDSTRIGVWGWSGGGTMTLNCMFRYPEIYKVGIAVAAVSDLHYYDTIYEERYMGLPGNGSEEDPYVKCSAINQAKNLKGDLLIIHGTGDDNVHYQNAEAVINQLIQYNKLFWMMAYPNRSHGIYEGRNTRHHLFKTITHFLMTHLPAGGR
jgi:dipeptidyl-peptidase-4